MSTVSDTDTDATGYETALDYNVSSATISDTSNSTFNQHDTSSSTIVDMDLSGAGDHRTFDSSSTTDDDRTISKTSHKRKHREQHRENEMGVIDISSDDENDQSTLSDKSLSSLSPTSSIASTSVATPRGTTSKSDFNTANESDNTIKIYGSVEEFDKNLPDTVTLLNSPNGGKVYLVGTAHFSEKSQDDVSTVIRNVKPDIVLVELCPARVHILKYDEKILLEEAREINIAKVRNIIQTSGLTNGAFYVLFLNMSAKITKQLGMAPGGEFRRALEEARRLPQCSFILGDRPINVTVQRALHGLSFWQSLKLLFRLITSNETISKEEVEKCKEKDLLEELIEEMADEYPALSQVFVKERDMFLCHSLQLAAIPDPRLGQFHRPLNVVGVVGIGHTAGIKGLWGHVDPTKIPEISVVPPASRTSRAVKFTMKYGTLCLISYGIYRFVRPRIGSIL